MIKHKSDDQLTVKISVQINYFFPEIPVISLKHTELDIRMVGSFRNIFKKMKTTIQDKTLVTTVSVPIYLSCLTFCGQIDQILTNNQ